MVILWMFLLYCSPPPTLLFKLECAHTPRGQLISYIFLFFIFNLPFHPMFVLVCDVRGAFSSIYMPLRQTAVLVHLLKNEPICHGGKRLLFTSSALMHLRAPSERPLQPMDRTGASVLGTLVSRSQILMYAHKWKSKSRHIILIVINLFFPSNSHS